MGLADPPNQWDAETATAPMLEASEPAGYPVGGWLVSVDTTHFEPLIGSENGCLLPRFQEAFRPGRVRLQNWRA